MDKQLRYVITGVDKNAGTTLTSVGDKGEKAGHKITEGFSKVGQLIGGEVGEAIQEASDKLEHFGKGNRLAAVGAAAAGLGGILSVMGSKEQAATQQLDTAITNSGHSVEDYGHKIEETVGHMEHYGHSAVDTKNALATLTNATHDPAKALDLMAEAADLAASKHESLGAASEQLAKVVGGHGAKTLAAYNIELVKNADGTTNWTATNAKLAEVLSGQASAASSTFTGHLKALRTVVEDNVAAFGQKYGPAIMVAGTAMTTLKPVVEGFGNLFKAVSNKIAKVGPALDGVAESAKTSSESVVASEEAAAAAEDEGAAGSVDVAQTHVQSDQTVASSSQAASQTVVAAEAAAAEAEDSGAAGSQVVAAEHVRADSIIADSSEAAKVAVVESSAEMAAAQEEAAIASRTSAAESAGASSKMGALGLAAAGLTIGVMAGVSAWNEYHKQAKVNAEAVDSLTAAISADSGALGENVRQTVASNLEKEGALKVAGKYGISLSLLTSASMGDTQAQAQLTTQVKALSAAHKISNGDILKLNTAMVGMSSITADAEGKTQRLKDATSAASGSINVMAGSAVYSVTKLNDLAHSGQLTNTQLAALIKAKRVDVRTAQAQANLATLKTYLDSIQSKTVTVGITTFTSNGGSLAGTGKKMNAGGTDYFSGGQTTIAEREPEVVDLPRGSKITPVSRLHSGGVTNNYHINLSVMGDAKSAARVLLTELQRLKGSGVKVGLS